MEALQVNTHPENGMSRGVNTPMDVIMAAIQNEGFDIDKMERLIAMQEKWQSNQDKKSFQRDFALLQCEIPKIKKNGKADYGVKNGVQGAKYSFALLDDITAAIKPACQKYGFSWRFKYGKTEKGEISVTCVVMHKDGHTEEVTMSGPADSSGNKNAIQQNGSSLSYLQRYTLVAAFGITSANEDDDGHKYNKPTIDQKNKELEEAKALYRSKLKDLESFPSEVPKQFLEKNWKIADKDRKPENYLTSLKMLNKWEEDEKARILKEDEAQ